jgi:sterol 3beta-glucosyltransferase
MYVMPRASREISLRSGSPRVPPFTTTQPMSGMQYVQGRHGNLQSYSAFELMMWSSFSREINKWRLSKLRLPYIYGLAQSSTNLVTAAKLPFSAMWSASFVPKPEDWPEQCEVVGAFFVEQKSNFDPKPFEDLLIWLKNGPKPVFIGFGSMVIQDPTALETIIKAAARKANVRVLVQSGWSKLDVEDESGLCNNVGPCPHDWLLPMCCAVIHHGGAGTTAAGLRLGLPTFICPFFGDQFMWGWFVSLAGVGPKACPITKLTDDILAQRLEELASPDLQKSANELAEDMAKEDGIIGGRNHFMSRLVVDNMLCDVSLLLGETQMARHRLIGSGLRHHGIKVCSEVAGKCW